MRLYYILMKRSKEKQLNLTGDSSRAEGLEEGKAICTQRWGEMSVVTRWSRRHLRAAQGDSEGIAKGSRM